MKRIASARSKPAKPVWFGCDVGKQMPRRDLGCWTRTLYDLEAVYDVRSTWTSDSAGVRGNAEDARQLLPDRRRRWQRAVAAGRELVGAAVQRASSR